MTLLSVLRKGGREGGRGGGLQERFSFKYEIFYSDSEVSMAHSKVTVAPSCGSYGPR